MAQITIEAHAIDTEFEESIQEIFGVKIVDRTNEPWKVVFEGEHSMLIGMVRKHWGFERADAVVVELRAIADSQGWKFSGVHDGEKFELREWRYGQAALGEPSVVHRQRRFDTAAQRDQAAGHYLKETTNDAGQ